MSRVKLPFYLLITCAVLAAVFLIGYGVPSLRKAMDERGDRSSAGLPSSDGSSSRSTTEELGPPPTKRIVERVVPTPDPARGPLPNILVITVDTLRGDFLGVNGNPDIKTPNLDALTRQGANFTLAISSFSQTNPAHASMFTGLYPSAHKSKHHCVDRISDSVAVLAELLGQNAYNTSAIYSWPCFEWDFGFERGFDLFQGAYISGTGDRFSDRNVDGRADATTNAVLAWAGQKPAQPYFLWVHYQDPHYPYAPPPPFDTIFDPDCRGCLDGSWDAIDRINSGQPLTAADIRHMRAMYAGEVSFTDQEIGRLLDGMREAGLLDNTMVILTSDHGESFADNGLWFHPWIVHNSVIRVPLLVSYPPAIPAETVVGGVVRTLDIMPTILDVARVAVPPQIDGQSLLPLIQGTEAEGRRTAFAETLDNSMIAIVSGDWKLIKYFKTNAAVLFNIRADPGEVQDLAGVNPEQVLAMQEELQAWMDSHGIKPAIGGQ